MDKILLNVGETCELTGLSRSKLLELAYRGDLPSVRVGRRRLFLADAVREWAQGLAPAQRGMGH